MDQQYGAYHYYPTVYTDNAHGTLTFPDEGLTMSRHRSQASSSSNEAYSTVSEYSGDLLPTTPISPGDMANYAYYENYGPTPYLDPDGFEDNNYYCSNDGQVADYYDQADSNGYAMSSGLETTPGIYQNPTPQGSLMSSTIPEPQEVQSAMHVCDIPDCETTKPFKRKADLQRHHEQRHQTQEQKKRFDCDYSKCDRHQTPFHRMDHFRDHYRDFHKEELPRKRGESDEWYAEKAKTASKRWWRCVKCLNRVYIKESGFDCSCGSTCDKPRRQLRGFAA